MYKQILKTMIGAFLFIGLINISVASELKTITLDVDGMVCSVCPITVKKALKKVDGVSKAEAVYEGNGNGLATVTYDADKTNVEALTQATKKAGYPSHIKQ